MIILLSKKGYDIIETSANVTVTKDGKIIGKTDFKPNRKTALEMLAREILGNETVESYLAGILILDDEVQGSETAESVSDEQEGSGSDDEAEATPAASDSEPIASEPTPA
jgi:ABC-type uncharacterized transport system ATPase subunit